jgi:hypothetical protein
VTRVTVMHNGIPTDLEDMRGRKMKPSPPSGDPAPRRGRMPGEPLDPEMKAYSDAVWRRWQEAEASSSSHHNLH